MIPILLLQVMYEYVVFHFSIDYCVELILVNTVVWLWNELSYSFGEMYFEKNYKKVQKNQILTNLRVPSLWNHWVY